MNRLNQKYNDEIVAKLMEKFNYSSTMQVPKLVKIVVNMGVGDAIGNPKAMEEAVAELAQITGQKPVITKAKKSIANFKLREGMEIRRVLFRSKAKKSIANFKLREGMEIGTKVTLRGERMWDFFDKLVNISLPRVRDFHGVSRTAFDGRGNYTLGVKEQLIFPEVNYDKVAIVRGMDIVIVTTAKTNEEAFALLQLLGMPFAR